MSILTKNRDEYANMEQMEWVKCWFRTITCYFTVFVDTTETKNVIYDTERTLTRQSSWRCLKSEQIWIWRFRLIHSNLIRFNVSFKSTLSFQKRLILNFFGRAYEITSTFDFLFMEQSVLRRTIVLGGSLEYHCIVLEISSHSKVKLFGLCNVFVSNTNGCLNKFLYSLLIFSVIVSFV